MRLRSPDKGFEEHLWKLITLMICGIEGFKERLSGQPGALTFEKGKRRMKIVGMLLVIGILFSYVPMIPTDDCPEGNHMGNIKMDCGNLFHCPLIFFVGLQEPLPLPLSGWLVLAPTPPKVDELTHLIFHPPENQIINSPS